MPSHNTRPVLRIVMQEHEMSSGGVTWLSPSANNYQIIKTSFFFFFKCHFQLKQLNDNEASAWGRREKRLKIREFPPVNLQAKGKEPYDGVPTWGYSTTAAGLLKDLHDPSHKSTGTSSTTKVCTKERKSSACMARFTPHHRHN